MGKSWLPITGEPAWQSPTLFAATLPRDELPARFGPPQLAGAASDRHDRLNTWLLRFSCGLEVAIRSFPNSPARPRSSNEQDTIEVHANQPDRDHLLFHLGLTGDAIRETAPARLINSPETHQVLRLDDNGNEFEVTRVTSPCEATAIAQRYEAKGHKQTYWIRAIAPCASKETAR